MPGPILTAAEAKKTYGFRSIKRSGDKVTLKNSGGKKVTVSSGARVYHRGHGNFGIYSTERDEKRYTGSGEKYADRVGKGTYRHTGIAGKDPGKPKMNWGMLAKKKASRKR